MITASLCQTPQNRSLGDRPDTFYTEVAHRLWASLDVGLLSTTRVFDLDPFMEEGTTHPG